jgi:hypothetical protein
MVRRFHGTLAQDTLKDDLAAFVAFMANPQTQGEKNEVRIVTNRKTAISTQVGGMACHVYHKNLIDMIRVAYNHNLGVALTPEAIIFSINMEIQKLNELAAVEGLSDSIIAEYADSFKSIDSITAATKIVEAADMDSLSLVDFIGNGCDPFTFCSVDVDVNAQFNFTTRNITHVKVMDGVPEKIIENLTLISQKFTKNTLVSIYIKKMILLMEAIRDNLDNKYFWENMFYVHYSNGKSVEDGWIFDIVNSAEYNSATFYDHVCSIEFVDSISGVRFQMVQGIFSSAVDANSTLVPLNNSKIIYQLA